MTKDDGRSGTTLALSLSRRLARPMRGKIVVEGRGQVGPIVTLILPRVQAI